MGKAETILRGRFCFMAPLAIFPTMEMKWLNPDEQFDELVLAGDIGGTNTNLGLVGIKAGKFSLILECVFPSANLHGLHEPILETLKVAKAKRSDLSPTHCCISAAGPVANNFCKMTNLAWEIDGDALTKSVGIPVLVINDFLAISYGIPTLDVNDPKQIHQIQHTDGSLPPAQPSTKAVIGPGTGMGVSFLAFDGKRHIPASSEGGHIGFAPFDEVSKAFQAYMAKKMGNPVPGVEPFVSGTGIRNLYAFWRDTKGLPDSAGWNEIETTPDADRPKMISRLSDKDPIAAEMMRTFVRMLGRFASDISAVTLPLGGFYLAGGVAQKELRWLEGDCLFAQYFEQSYNANLVPLLKRIPIYLIKDYSISLYGAANASLQLR